ncbi:MAG: glycosyltransferase family 4 protein, partial [Saprospiraceae bacterium]
MKIAFVGNYPPKACGIGTFTDSLTRAILSNLNASDVADYAEVLAMEDPHENHDYPPVVTRVIRSDRPADYRAAADYLNENDFDLVVLQHEYGIFGGDDGAYILHLLDRLELPLVTTLHTVLKDPSTGQKTALRRIGKRSQQVVVMSQMAAGFLRDVFGLPTQKIAVIEHGVPIVKLQGREELREQLGWTGRSVIFTFGLLGRGKGIETAVRALPAIVDRHPETLYVVLGKTHPNVVRNSGEEYREYLHQLADELGVGDNLRMIGEFATEQKLFEHLRACDVYVIPYPNEAQITSGTLAYAVGAGTAVVSTPFWHATELLAEERGLFFPFHDSTVLAEQCNRLLEQPELTRELRLRTADYGKQLLWPKIGEQYLRVFGRAQVAFEARLQSARNTDFDLPPLCLDHLRRMTDDTGLMQHAKYAIPNRHEGYCLDDNGRGLLLIGMLVKRGLGDLAELQRLAEIYLSYVYHAQNPDGSFRNFMGYDREFMERVGSEDSFGRALWGVAYCLANPPRADMRDLLVEIFDRAVNYLEHVRSPRTISYGIIALTHYLEYRPGNENILNQLDRLTNRLVEHYDQNRGEEWDWFERYLTYSNGIMPYALYRTLQFLDKDKTRAAAGDATRFLTEMTIVDGVMRPIGCEAPFLFQGKPSRYDQQPTDVMAKVLLFAEAAKYDESMSNRERLRIAFNWFLGANDLKLPLYQPETAGCYDGLMESGMNRNQGAESLLAYLISRV